MIINNEQVFSIPGPILKDKKLNNDEKMFFGYIASICEKNDGYCTKNNEALQELCGIGRSTVQKYLKKLRDDDYIKIDYVTKTDRIVNVTEKAMGKLVQKKDIELVRSEILKAHLQKETKKVEAPAKVVEEIAAEVEKEAISEKIEENLSREAELSACTDKQVKSAQVGDFSATKNGLRPNSIIYNNNNIYNTLNTNTNTLNTDTVSCINNNNINNIQDVTTAEIGADIDETEELVEEWNRIGLEQVETDKSKHRILNLLGRFGKKKIIKCWQKIKNSSFLNGTKTTFRAWFGWATKPEIFIKILNGRYDDFEVKPILTCSASQSQQKKTYQTKKQEWKPGRFNNFKPRDYDYADLERQLLGYDPEEA